VDPIADLSAIVRDLRIDLGSLSPENLHFWHRSQAGLLLVAMVAICFAVIVVRRMVRRLGGRHRVTVAALPGSIRGSSISLVRHVPALLVALGVLLFAVALADPYSALGRREESFPGRRIALMIDASSSMRALFNAGELNKTGMATTTFLTTVGAAERFVRLRMNGKYRDLLALIEFGDEAYVVTPFTNDYDNILLSISLIADPVEFARFPDPGTVIGNAIDMGTKLFRTFDFLDSAGNLIVIFSDGEDMGDIVRGRPLDEILADAVAAEIPVYLVRTSYEKELGGLVPDALWKAAVEKTGGKFYAASNEGAILEAIRDIDSVSQGRIRVTRYVTQTPRFMHFAAMALALWTLAAVGKLTIPYFRTFP
jgi:Ca-activated chloride channel family protein